MESYNKFLDSGHNSLKIQPIEPEYKIYNYYVGVFKRLKNIGTNSKEYEEVEQAISGSRVEDYFPLIVDCLNKRMNWKCLNNYDALNIHYIDFSLTNASKISKKSNIHYRFLLDSINHYISNKKYFYEKFKNYNFIPKFESFTKLNIDCKKDIIENLFYNKSVIIKPDKGSISTGILTQEKFNFDKIKNHIINSNFEDWTISEIIMPKLHEGYIVSNRIYILMIKYDNKKVKTYFYKEFMNYRTVKPFEGDITDPEQFLTNFMDRENNPNADEEFVKNRYIPHDIFMQKFTSDQQCNIYSQLHYIFSIISDKMKDDILCYNDNKLNEIFEQNKTKSRGFFSSVFNTIQNIIYDDDEDMDPETYNEVYGGTSNMPEYIDNTNTEHNTNNNYYDHYHNIDDIQNNEIDQDINDNDEHQNNSSYLTKNKIVGFHVYGADILIDEDNNLKLIEINGAPSMNVKTRYYGLTDRLDYFDLMEEVIQKVVDPIFPPYNKQPPLNNFIEIYNGEREEKNSNGIYYIPTSIVKKYPFIYDSIKKRNLKRTKTLYDKIDFFYGLRERYVTDDTNMNYYDEILHYLTSKRLRKTPIINKIQGITYYLASKDGLYSKMIEKYGNDIAHNYHPESILVFFSSIEKIYLKIKHQLNNYNYIDNWILKPVHGSRGLGVKVFSKNKYNSFSDFLYAIVDYINYYSTIGYDSVIDTGNYTYDGHKIVERTNNKYKYWILGRYIDNPDLIKVNPTEKYGRKYNIRFYVLLTINKLPTFKDIDKFDENKTQYKDIITAHLYNDCMIYYSMLDYYDNQINKPYDILDEDNLESMRSLTNLEIINKIKLKFDELGIPFDAESKKIECTDLLSNIYTHDSNKFQNIMYQVKNMTSKTIDCVKYDLRPLNRFEDNYKGCFNLLAYDTMLDDNGKLWLIEINRGPDIMGLWKNIGYEGCVKFFDYIFKQTIDTHYGDIDELNCDGEWEKINIDYHVYGNNKLIN